MRVWTEADFDFMMRGAKLIAVVAAWTELGLFDKLAASADPVALAELPGEPRAIELTAPVLMNAGLLDGDGAAWKLSSVGRRLFERGELPGAQSLEWLGDVARMGDVLRHGGPVRAADGTSKLTRGGVRPDDVDRTRRFLDTLYRRSADSAAETASWIARRAAPGAHALDLGGGHGRYAHELVARGLRATLFDLPVPAELARERFEGEVRVLAGDYKADALGGPYDVVLLSNIVHGEDRAANEALVRKVAGELAPGGWIVIKDMFIDEQGRDPEGAALFNTTMLFYTEGGRSYGLSDARAWCEAAGLSGFEAIAVSTFTLTFARKP
jgi:SAM-dependent methyltransferase